MENTFKKRTKKGFGIIAVLIVVIVFFSIMSSNFLTLSNMRTILLQVSSTCVCSLGMMFVLVTGGIDLSVGYMASAAGMLSAFCMTTANMNGAAAFLVTLLFALVIGAIQGILIAKIKVPPFIVTMAFMNGLKGFSYLITSGRAIYDLPDFVRGIGQGTVLGIPLPVLIMVILIIITSFFTRKIYVGRYFYAVGSNEEAARLAGINSDAVKIATYMLSSFFAYLAGIIMMGRLATASPNSGDGFEFDVITACVLGGVSMSGGKGKVYQAVVGAIIIAALNNGMIQLHIDTYVQLVIKGLILLLAVVFDCLQQNRKQKVKLAA
ncbi:MAG: ABC transporter permease [Lachnospiraceae bacterium]|nr:ABC transporter permease [Lachnospiraceae bacterium]